MNDKNDPDYGYSFKLKVNTHTNYDGNKIKNEYIEADEISQDDEQ
jgi:hypothetical protein